MTFVEYVSFEFNGSNVTSIDLFDFLSKHVDIKMKIVNNNNYADILKQLKNTTKDSIKMLKCITREREFKDDVINKY